LAEPIEVPFGMWTRMGPRNYVLGGVQIPPQEGHFSGEMMSEFYCTPPSKFPVVLTLGFSHMLTGR